MFARDVPRMQTAMCTHAGSLPPEASCSFPTRDNSEPPTSDDLAYVPMSSFGPESSLSPPTTSAFIRGNPHTDGQPPELAFPSPFAVSHPSGSILAARSSDVPLQGPSQALPRSQVLLCICKFARDAFWWGGRLSLTMMLTGVNNH